MDAQAAFLALSLHLSLNLRNLSTFAALCFDPATLQRHNKSAINYWRVLTKKRGLTLGQLDGEDLNRGGFKRGDNHDPIQRLTNKQNHLPATHLGFHNSNTAWH